MGQGTLALSMAKAGLPLRRLAGCEIQAPTRDAAAAALSLLSHLHPELVPESAIANAQLGPTGTT